MFCEKCFSEIAEGAAFCKECGHPVNRNNDSGTGAAEMPSPVSASSVQLPFVPASFQPEPVKDTPEPMAEELSPSASLEPEMPSAPQPVLAPQTFQPAQPVSQPAQPAFVPQSFAAPQSVFSSAPIQAAYGYPGFGSAVEEGDYYHFDATETPDFEAMRGISIALLIISACTVFGIVFPLPLCIASLVMSCTGIGERDPRRALNKFSTCRTLVIITVVTLLIFLLVGLIFVAAFGYLSDFSSLAQTEKDSFSLFF